MRNSNLIPVVLVSDIVAILCYIKLSDISVQCRSWKTHFTKFTKLTLKYPGKSQNVGHFQAIIAIGW